MNSKCYDLVKQFLYHFQLNLFYPERMSNNLWKYDILLFSEFIDVLPAFTCVIDNLGSICLGFNILRWLVTPRHFLWLGIFLIFNTLSVILFAFWFSGISILFTESINDFLRCFRNLLTNLFYKFLIQLSSYIYFCKEDGS